eukprot:TRINITY_DN29603_c1_g1_i3.p1 TRINITY_DN29603_c1_g1~~TRINITY_DN29603_c1_g1_i3.p1  ORF type:complete len:717 (+),score=104.41 TRINITY_DN29603_c1_g1_i3:320-2152(+)
MLTEDQQNWAGTRLNANEVMGEEWIKNLQKVSQYLNQLGVSEVNREAYAQVATQQLNSYLISRSFNSFRDFILEDALEYVRNIPLQLINFVLQSQQNSDEFDEEDTLQQWYDKMQFYVYEALAESRIQDMFDIVKDYPNSVPALQDFQRCLASTNLRDKLVQTFRQAVFKRLLNAGTQTNLILEFYLNIIKCFRILDPSGLLLENVVEPICAYLRRRPDTITCVINMITDQNNPGFFYYGEQAQQGHDMHGIYEEAKLFQQMDDWEPERVEVDPDHINTKPDDTIQKLVMIYGGEEFAEQYRIISANKLLAKTDYDVDHDTIVLENLRLLFGEGLMSNCDVMLKDVKDSRWVNQRITSDMTSNDLTMQSTIISYLFWPKNVTQTEDLKLPEAVDTALQQYAQLYEKHKGSRKLDWLKTQGAVDLELTVGEYTVNVKVGPVQACILFEFEQQKVWSVKQLAEKLNISEQLLRRKAAFWIIQGVLRESKNEQGEAIYARMDNLPANSQLLQGEMVVAMEDDSPSRSQSVTMSEPNSSQRGPKVYFERQARNIIFTHKDGVPLSRVHFLMQKMCHAPKYDLNQDDLHAMLETMIQKGIICLEGGKFKCVSEPS